MTPLRLALLLVVSLAPGLLACRGGEAPIQGADASIDRTSDWPKQIALTYRWDYSELGLDTRSGVRLSDGSQVSPEEADIALTQAMVLSLYTQNLSATCLKGVFASLEDIPTSLDVCPNEPIGPADGDWQGRIYLSASSIHEVGESQSIGLGALLWDRPATTLYRMRLLGDSYDEEGLSTAVLEYEPVVFDQPTPEL